MPETKKRTLKDMQYDEVIDTIRTNNKQKDMASTLGIAPSGITKYFKKHSTSYTKLKHLMASGSSDVELVGYLNNNSFQKNNLSTPNEHLSFWKKQSPCTVTSSSIDIASLNDIEAMEDDSWRSVINSFLSTKDSESCSNNINSTISATMFDAPDDFYLIQVKLIDARTILEITLDFMRNIASTNNFNTSMLYEILDNTHKILTEVTELCINNEPVMMDNSHSIVTILTNMMNILNTANLFIQHNLSTSTNNNTANLVVDNDDDEFELLLDDDDTNSNTFR